MSRAPVLLAILVLVLPVPGTAAAGGATPECPPGYAELLRTFTVEYPMRNGGFESRFAYAVLHAEPGQEERRSALREAFLSVDPAVLPPARRTAWAINTYNFLVIDAVVEHYVDADGDTLDSIADIGETPFAVFDEEWFSVAGEPMSLNRFEHRFLFDGVDREGETIPPGLDPRLHFVIVCAAKGCPALWPEPFFADGLDERIEAATRNALLSPTQVVYEGSVVHVSRIFEWYAADFRPIGGTAAFLRRHAEERVRRAVMEGRVDRTPPDIEWDWSLNAP